MFNNCISLNSPIIFNEGTVTFANTFVNCVSLNSDVTFPNSATSFTDTFKDCHKFNKKVTLPEGASSFTNMFRNCYKFNQQVTIPSTATTVLSMFDTCTSMYSDIYILKETGTLTTSTMLANRSCHKPMNIYCKNSDVIVNPSTKQSRYGMINTLLINFEEISPNNYYNSLYQLYVYNYIPG